jgi:hypothetical protein
MQLVFGVKIDVEFFERDLSGENIFGELLNCTFWANVNFDANVKII